VHRGNPTEESLQKKTENVAACLNLCVFPLWDSLSSVVVFVCFLNSGSALAGSKAPEILKPWSLATSYFLFRFQPLDPEFVVYYSAITPERRWSDDKF